MQVPNGLRPGVPSYIVRNVSYYSQKLYITNILQKKHKLSKILHQEIFTRVVILERLKNYQTFLYIFEITVIEKKIKSLAYGHIRLKKRCESIDN